MSTGAELAGAMMVGAEREVKRLVDAVFGEDGPFGDRISVGWPDDRWLLETPCPRIVVAMRRWKVLGTLRSAEPDKVLDVEDEKEKLLDYKETWYRKADALMVMEIAFQSRGRSVLTDDQGNVVGGVDHLSGVLVDGIEMGLVFPATGKFAGEYQVKSEIEGEDVPPEKEDAANRIFERRISFVVSGPLYEVRQEYLGETFEKNVEVSDEPEEDS